MELASNAFAAWKSKVHQLLAGSSSREEGLYIHPLECLGTRKAINLIDTDLGPHLHIPVRVEDAPKPAAPSHRDTGLQAPTVGNAPKAPEDGNHVVIGAGQWTRVTHPIAVRTIPENRVEEAVIADEMTGMGIGHTDAVRAGNTQLLRLGNHIGAILHLT